MLYARDGFERVDDALLRVEDGAPAVAGSGKVDIHDDGVVRLEAEVAVKGADQTAHSDKRRGDENGADGDLNDKEDIAEGDAAAECEPLDPALMTS